MTDRPVYRRFPRYPIQLPILYKVIIPPTRQAGAGWTRNLSEGGACLELAESLQPATSLQVLLRTEQRGTELEAQVVWTRAAGSTTSGVLHGVAFTQMVPADRQALRDLLHHKGWVRPAGVRLPVELTITCQRKDDAGPLLQGWTGDISRGGLLLRLPQGLPPGTVLEITLPTIYGPVTAEGTIVWVEPPDVQTPGEPIRYGFRFTNITWASELTLGLFLAEALDRGPQAEV